MPDQLALQWDSSNILFAYHMAELIQAIHYPEPINRAESLWSDWGYPIGQISFRGDIGALPGALGVIAGEYVIVAVGGTDSVSQVVDYVLGALAGTIAGSEGPTVFTFFVWGERVARYISDNVSLAGRHVMLTGHSYGGAVATIAANVLATDSDAASVSCVTFGAPRVAGDWYNERLRLTGLRRWMAYGDPVPDLPPGAGQFAPALRLGGKVISRVAGLYEDLPGGAIVYQDGTINFRNEPQWLELFGGGVPATEARVSDQFNGARHRLSAYVETMRRAAARTHPARFDSLGRERPITFSLPLRRSIAPVPRSYPLTLINWTGEPTAEGIMSPYVPTSQLPKVQKSGSKWAVNFQGLPIIIFETRSQAKTVAKHLTRFLRRMQLCYSFDTTNWTSAFGAYVNIASGGGAGFRPNTFIVT